MSECTHAPGPRHSPGIFRETIRQTSRMVGAFAAASAVTVGAVSALDLGHRLDLGPAGSAEPLAAGLSGPVAKAQRLADAHGCWHGAPPPDMQGQIPGHVVVTIDAPRGARTVYSSAQVSAALDHVFVAPHSDLVVHAFCR